MTGQQREDAAREAIAKVIYDYWLSITEQGDWPERWEDEDAETQQGFLEQADKVLAVIGRHLTDGAE